MNGLQLISFFVLGQILNLTAESRLELFWLIQELFDQIVNKFFQLTMCGDSIEESVED